MYNQFVKKSLYFIVVSIIGIFSVSPVANAAKPVGGGATTVQTGNDISWPQCGRSLPTNHAFGVVGVNGGNAANTNPCLAEQLVWGSRASGKTSQPKLQLYVNTANPGEVIDQIESWPSSNVDQTGYVTTSPYGSCVTFETNDLPCSWQYGWNRAVSAVQERFAPAAAVAGVSIDPADYVWWLDVETMNTWQSGGTAALARNTAALEGMTAYFQYKNVKKVGIYSTNYQWGVIVGNTVGTNSNLNGLDNWVAGARSIRGAQSNCKGLPLTSGSRITLSQYVAGNLDYDVSCVN